MKIEILTRSQIKKMIDEERRFIEEYFYCDLDKLRKELAKLEEQFKTLSINERFK